MNLTRQKRVVSRVKHHDKYKCVLLCIDKEKEGYECVSPIQRKYYYSKNFRRDGKFYDFVNADQDVYYEAVYVREMKS